MRFILILAFLLLTTFYGFSQQKFTFSTGVYGGLFIPTKILTIKETSSVGYNFGLDFEFRKRGFSFYLSTFYNPGVPKYDEATGLWEKYGIFDLSVGPRWFIGKKILFGTIELGFGYYRSIYSSGPGGGVFGFNTGLGLNYSLSKAIDISLKGKYHLMGKNYFTPFGGVYLGMRYYFTK